MSRKVLICAGVAIVLMLVGWFEVFYRPENSHIASLKTKEQTVQASLTALQAHYLGLVASEKRLPAERRALARLMRSVPDGPDLDTLELTLFTAAHQAGVNLMSIASPLPTNFGAQQASPASSGTSGPNQFSLSVGVLGSPEALIKFYAILDAEPRLFVIDNFVVPVTQPKAKGPHTGDETGGTMDIRAFYSSPNSRSAAS